MNHIEIRFFPIVVYDINADLYLFLAVFFMLGKLVTCARNVSCCDFNGFLLAVYQGASAKEVCQNRGLFIFMVLIAAKLD